MNSPLPAAPGTPDTVITQGFKMLQKRLLAHGGQILDVPENTATLAQYLKANDFKMNEVVFTAAQVCDALWEAVCNNFHQLKFNPMPMKLYAKLNEAAAQRKQIRDMAKRAEEARQNNTPYDVVSRIQEAQAAKDKLDRAAAEDKARQDRNQLIADYSVNSQSMAGRIDHAKSEEGRAYLKTVKITGKDGKLSEILTLAAVERLRWCDTPQEMARVLDRWLHEMNEDKTASRRQIEGSGYVGSRGR